MMKAMKQFLQGAILSFVIISTPALADPQADADYIVSQTVTKPMFEAAIAAQRDLITAAIQQQLRSKNIRLPDPDRFFDLFIEEFIDEFVQSMRDQSASIYIDNFSPRELADIAEFFKTESGMAYIAATPKIIIAGAQMGRIAGEKAGRNAGQIHASRIEEEGLAVVDDPGILQQLLDILR